MLSFFIVHETKQASILFPLQAWSWVFFVCFIDFFTSSLSACLDSKHGKNNRRNKECSINMER